MLIAIVIGGIVIAVKGFNFSVEYANHKRIEIALDTDFKDKDIKKIVKDTVDSKAVVKKSTLFGTSVIIETKEISDDELSNLLDKIDEKYNKDYKLKDIKLPSIVKEMKIEKVSSKSEEEVNELISQIKEKYGFEYTSEELSATSSKLKISDVDAVKLTDLIRPYAFSILISVAIILVYYAIRYNKLEKKAWIKEPVRLLIRLVLVQAFLAALVGLCRFAVNAYIIDVMVFIMILQIFTETIKNEKKLAKQKAEN